MLDAARLTTADAAQQLRVSPKQVREYVYQGRLAARCEGRRLYVLPRDIEAFCAAMPAYDASATMAEPKVKTFRRYGRANAKSKRTA